MTIATLSARHSRLAKMTELHLATQTARRFDHGHGYDRFMEEWSRAAGAIFLDWMGPPRGADWLDVGCGTGAFTELIQRESRPRSVAAIDASPAQIARAAAKSWAQSVELRIGDARELPYGDAQFGVVVSALVLNLIDEPQRAVAEMARVARPGGLIAAYVWDVAGELSPSWPLRRGLRPGNVGAVASRAAHAGPAALTRSFVAAGLVDISIGPIEIRREYPDFETFWEAQTATDNPLAREIAAMEGAALSRLKTAVRNAVSPCRDETAYTARAIAVRGRVRARPM
jgi:SAM-dependent methyltransferase